MRRLALLIAVAIAGSGFLALPATSSAATPRTSLNAVESEVMCVSCGVPLVIADSPQADAERREINELIRQGKTKDQIKAALVADYGPRVLATPQHKGFGLAAYLVPIVLVLLAILAGILVLPKWRARNREDAMVSPAAGPALSADDARRLEDDLARYEV